VDGPSQLIAVEGSFTASVVGPRAVAGGDGAAVTTLAARYELRGTLDGAFLAAVRVIRAPGESQLVVGRGTFGGTLDGGRCVRAGAVIMLAAGAGGLLLASSDGIRALLALTSTSAQCGTYVGNISLETRAASVDRGRDREPVKRACAWEKDDPFGVEFAEIALEPERVSAEGVAIGVEPIPYRLDYMLETAAGFVTSRLRVSSRGEGWRRTLDLRRDTQGAWSVDVEEEGDVDLPSAGGDPATLTGALDCDLGLSPVTNLMPILRHDLLSGGGPIELTTAWVSVPDLAVMADGQRYAFVRADQDSSVIRYEAIDGTFAADIILDSEGIVIDFPGIARRLVHARPRFDGRRT
jgi:hypothetical protein